MGIVEGPMETVLPKTVTATFTKVENHKMIAFFVITFIPVPFAIACPFGLEKRKIPTTAHHAK